MFLFFLLYLSHLSSVLTFTAFWNESDWINEHFHGCFCFLFLTFPFYRFEEFSVCHFSPTQGLKANILTHFVSSVLLLFCSLLPFLSSSLSLHHIICPSSCLHLSLCLWSVCLPACSQYSVLQPRLQSSPLGTCSVRARDPTPSHMCAGTETRTFLSMTTCAWTRYHCSQNPSSDSLLRDLRNISWSAFTWKWSSRVVLNYQNRSSCFLHHSSCFIYSRCLDLNRQVIKSGSLLLWLLCF